MQNLSSLIEMLNKMDDPRQDYKVKHKLIDIIVIVIFGKLANADSWEDMASFALSHESFLRKYLELPNGIPSHDTIQRVFSVINPDILQFFVNEWNNFLLTDEG